jgi:hypothetical protein
MTRFGGAGRLDEAAALLARLGDLAAGHPGEPEVRLRLAQGAYNLAYALGGAGRLTEQRALYLRYAEALASEAFVQAHDEAFGPDRTAGFLEMLAQLGTGDAAEGT